MLTRLIILLVFCITIYGVYRIVVWWQISKASALKDQDPLLQMVNFEIPTIVYFTTPMCALCRTTQMPAIERLKNIMNEVNIIKVNAAEDPDSLKRWGVMSAPTTFILDKKGAPVKVNNGFVDEMKLQSQIREAHLIA